MLWSPTYVLATQIGNSFEISHILASFLIGFGFQAYVVCGYVDESVSKMNRTEEKCPFLTKDEEKKELDASHLTTKYTPKKPPELKSKYVQFLQKLKQDSLAGKNTMASVGMFNKDYGNTGWEVFTVEIQKKLKVYKPCFVFVVIY